MDRNDLDLIEKALVLSTESHAGQTRKYTGEPYRNHPEAVAEIVRSVEHSPEMLCAAYLHDVVEDCGVELVQIGQEFGWEVMSLVYWLTNISKPSDGNRAKRKEIDRKHLCRAPPAAQTIKYADLIDNLSSIVKHDPKFAEVYQKEKALLLATMDKGNPTLLRRARDVLNGR